jgi:hypothetical protein
MPYEEEIPGKVLFAYGRIDDSDTEALFTS